MDMDAHSETKHEDSGRQKGVQPFDRKRPRGEGDSPTFSDSAAAAGQHELGIVKMEHDHENKHSNKNPGKLKFDDPSTADVLLKLTVAPSSHLDLNSLDPPHHPGGESKVYLHSSALHRSRYFRTLLSNRWQDSKPTRAAEGTTTNPPESGTALESSSRTRDDLLTQIHMTVPSTRELASYLETLRLLYYSGDFCSMMASVASAVAILQVASELLFDECTAACIAFLEAVPWTQQEEKLILLTVSEFQLEETAGLLARLNPVEDNAVENMLSGLVHAAMHSPRNISVSVKTFVARMLGEHGSRDSVRVVLEGAFGRTLKTVKDSVEDYSNPNVRGRYDEIEALQRQNLHTAVVNGRSLLWLVERMIELRVAKFCVTEWSEQGTFTANLKRAFSDDTWRNIAPGLPALVLRCTCRLASAVAAGSIIVSTQVRLKLVNDWLPVLIVSRENTISATHNKPVHKELEDVFLRIILTLPMAEAQKLLQQCLSFATRTVEDCPQLVSAFNTWFRRAGQNPPLLLPEDDDSDEQVL